MERIFFFVGVGVKVVFCLPGSTTRTGMVACSLLLLRSLLFAVALAAPRRRVGVAVVWYLPLLSEMRPYSPFAAKRHAALRESTPLGFGRAPGRLTMHATPFWKRW